MWSLWCGGTTLAERSRHLPGKAGLSDGNDLVTSCFAFNILYLRKRNHFFSLGGYERKECRKSQEYP